MDLSPIDSRGFHEKVYETRFTALNNSGVSGGAVVLLDQHTDTVTVDIIAKGLEPNEVHPQHIHGFTDGTIAMTPTIAQDVDHDGFVELAEGQKTYGPIQLNLTDKPGAAVLGQAPTSDFPTANANGTLHYHEVFHFDPSNPTSLNILNDIVPLDHKEIVLHGESVAAGSGAGTGGEVDGTGGYKAVLPVASGELHQVHGFAASLLAVGVDHNLLELFG